MLAIAITFPFVVGKSRTGSTGTIAKIILIPMMLVGTYFLVSQAENFIDLPDEHPTGVVQEANSITKNSQIGGSAFNEGVSLPVRIVESPFLMLRPFPWEMRNALAIAPALESIGLILLCWLRRREIWSTLRHWRDPYVGFILMYSVVFLVTFGGAISNFGILVRQRIMLTPLILMFICAKQKPLLLAARKQPGKDMWLARAMRMSRSDRIPTRI
jgi:hypothetical protein